MGGVRNIYLIPRAGLDVPVIDDSWFLSVALLGEITWIKIPVRGSFESVAQVDETTGATYYLDTLSAIPNPGIQDNSYQAGSLQAELASMGPDDLVVCVEMWDNTCFVMGFGFTDAAGAGFADFPVFFGGGQYASGTEKTDANGQSFVLTSVHPFMAAGFLLPDSSEVNNPSTD